jgi:hypothetical protein
LCPYYEKLCSVFVQDPGNAQDGLVIETSSQLPAFLSLIISILAKIQCPALPSEEFFADVLKRTTETAAWLTDLCLAPSYSVTSSKRNDTLTEVLTTLSLFPKSSGFENVLGKILFRVLRYTLGRGPSHGPNPTIDALLDAFKGACAALYTKSNAVVILDVLRSESWGSSGEELRVRNDNHSLQDETE